ncbi:MAG: glycosyltransferase [Acidimicrobiales bacterium]
MEVLVMMVLRHNEDTHGAVRLVDVEVGLPIHDIQPKRSALGGTYEQLRLLVRMHRQPLGTVSLRLPLEGLDAGLVADAVWAAMAGAIQAHCRRDGLPVPEKLTSRGVQATQAGRGVQATPAGRGLDHPGEACSWRRRLAGKKLPLVSLVVTTCGGPHSRLISTLDDAVNQTYPNYEIVVVDNRPQASGVREALADAFGGYIDIRYVAEHRPGLSYARNRGATAARGEIVAFTDDDVVLDRDWLANLVCGFDDPRVACVTGLILPLELETGAQSLLEEFGGYAKGFERRTWDCAEHRPGTPLYPYTVGVFGSGANAAFRTAALADLGGFDATLGTGTPARGGEDIDIYVTCVERGYRITYEPAAIVRHAHLRDMVQVRRKVHDYGVGLGAMLTKHLLQSPESAAAMLVRVPAGAVHLLSGSSTKNVSKSASYPKSLVFSEMVGLVYGPFAYLRSRALS